MGITLIENFILNSQFVLSAALTKVIIELFIVETFGRKVYTHSGIC